VFGVVGNPVSHSRSPALHNAAMAAAGFDGVYLPFLVDDFPRFIDAYRDRDFAGFSVTIPHKARLVHFPKPLLCQLIGISRWKPASSDLWSVDLLFLG
jgi:shikimate 5-dehydrogenase